MLDTPYQLTQKLTLNLIRHPCAKDETDVMGIAQDILHTAIEGEYGLAPDRVAFMRGGHFESEDGTAKARVASIQREEGQEDQALWAIQLRIRDPRNKRRNWAVNIGLRSGSRNSARLYYALGYFDHLAGAFSCPTPPMIEQGGLLDRFFGGERLVCVSGSYALPPVAVELSHASLPEFCSILEDPDRSIPIVLICCPDLVDPCWLQDIARGNLIVYWSDDMSVLARLNDSLAQPLQVEWDSIRVFLPLGGTEQYHPSFSCAEINRVGCDELIAGFCQAYCQSLRAEDRREFVSLDDILKLRDNRNLTMLHTRITVLEATSRTQAQQLEKASVENAVLKKRIETMVLQEASGDTPEYEEIMNEALAETDRLEASVSSLTAQLYGDMGKGFKPNEQEPCAHVRELSQAIHACFIRLQARR